MSGVGMRMHLDDQEGARRVQRWLERTAGEMS